MVFRVIPRSPLSWLILSVGLCAGLAGSRAGLRISHGLNAEYVVGDSPASSPSLTTVNSTVSTSEMLAAWKGSLPRVFHARWSGYLHVSRPGRYEFATTSDDGSAVTINSVVVVDNRGGHARQTRTGRIDLSTGPHFVVIEYSQLGGDAEMAWLWAEPGNDLRPVPSRALSPQPVSRDRLLIERRLDGFLIVGFGLVVPVMLWAAFTYAGRVLTRRPASTTSISVHSSSGAWLFPSAWTVFAGIIVIVACVPSYRMPWSETVTLHDVSSGVLVSSPLTRFATPYISFASVRFARRTDADDVPVVLVSGEDPVSSLRDLNSRTLITTRAGSTATPGGLQYDARLASAAQFRPSGAVRVVVLLNPRWGISPETSAQGVATVTIGCDGKTAAVSAIRYWWPGFAGVFLVVLLILLSPISRPFQQRSLIAIRQGIHLHRPLLWIAFASVVLRFVLVLGGGQYFDWDELRYGSGATRLFELLSTGNFNAAFRLLLDSPDHPGFRVVGLLPAFFHVVTAWSTGHPISDPSRPSGEWFAAFLLSLSAVWTVVLVYLLAQRVGASQKESVLAAFLMCTSSSMLIYARHFFPYDAAMALLLFSLWVGLARSDHPLRSYTVGFLSGVALLTYAGYWLMGGVVGLMHVLHKPVSIPVGWWRGVLFSAGAITLPALLVVSGILMGRPFLEDVVGFSTSIVNGDFSEGWSLPWAYLWNVEHGLLLVYASGIIATLYYGLKSPFTVETRRGLMWLVPAALVYAGLIIGSNVLHRFVVYDRLVRQMLPFIFLAAAPGLSRFLNGWLTMRRAWMTYGILAVLFAFNAAPLMTQRYPRDIVNEVMSRYAAAEVRLDSALMSSDEARARALSLLEPTEPPARPKRYVLLNAKEIWIAGGPPVLIPRPRGKVLFAFRHPRQLRSLQYHGYTPTERAFLRSVDFSIQLIDTQSEK